MWMRSYASVGAKCAENESNGNCENGQKYHGERSLPRVSGSKEEAVGRGVLVGLYVEEETRKTDTPLANLCESASARQGEMRQLAA